MMEMIRSRSGMVPVPFHEDTVFLVEHEGEPYVPLRPIVENLGLDWKSQHRKLMEKERRWGVVKLTTPSRGGRQQSLCLPLRRFFAFLSNIDATRVKAAIRPKLEMYQAECDDVLWRYWSGDEERHTQEDRFRQIIREELANFQPARKSAPPVTAQEKAAMRADILAGAGTRETARKFGRAESTVKDHTKAARAKRNKQMSLWEER